MGGLPALLQDVKKRDNKDRTFAPLDKDEERLKKLASKLILDSAEIPKDFDIDKLLENENEYININ